LYFLLFFFPFRIAIQWHNLQTVEVGHYSVEVEVEIISWWSVLLVEETGGRGENHRPAASHWQTWSLNVVHLVQRGVEHHLW
jgi:hypothetical protein